MGGRMGMVAILHTWGQNLSLHPHLHCIVPGGGITKTGKWKNTKSKGKYLFPVKAMSIVFRARFVAGLRKELGKSQPASFYESLFKNQWVVYCKRPFFGPSQVVEYLGRYTHKIAISNHRIKSLESGNVRFMVKDYRQGGKKSVLALSDAEFIRRFSLHILAQRVYPHRHYGILSSYYKRTLIPELQQRSGQRPELAEKVPLKHRKCPSCKKGNLVTIATSARGPRMVGANRSRNT
nr:transposase [Oceanihabitans sp. IOP_32]